MNQNRSPQGIKQIDSYINKHALVKKDNQYHRPRDYSEHRVVLEKGMREQEDAEEERQDLLERDGTRVAHHEPRNGPHGVVVLTRGELLRGRVGQTVKKGRCRLRRCRYCSEVDCGMLDEEARREFGVALHFGGLD